MNTRLYMCVHGCRYRKWRLSEEGGGLDLVVRCEVDGVMAAPGGASAGEVQLLSIKALNEHDVRSQVIHAAGGRVSVCMR
jgi:hypothetical protein